MAENEPVRIVALSSIAHFYANLDLNNLNSEKYYDVSVKKYGFNKRCYTKNILKIHTSQTLSISVLFR